MRYVAILMAVGCAVSACGSAQPGSHGSGGSSASGGSSGSGGSDAGGSGGAGAGSGGSPGSGGSASGGTTGSGSGGNAPPLPPFELEGGWIYLGPSDGTHDLTIDGGTMVYKSDDEQWSSKWTIKTYDNELHHFQVTFDSGSGTYLPVGQSMSGTYELHDRNLTIQLMNGLGSYPALKSAGSCTDETDGTPLPGCRVYTKGN